MKNSLLGFLIFPFILLMLLMFSSDYLFALRVYPDDIEKDAGFVTKRDFDDWERHDRRRYDDYYFQRNCESKAQRICREHRLLYWEYIDLSEYYRRMGRFRRADEYRRRADDSLRDYRHCLVRELNDCRRDFRRDRRW